MPEQFYGTLVLSGEFTDREQAQAVFEDVARAAEGYGASGGFDGPRTQEEDEAAFDARSEVETNLRQTLDAEIERRERAADPTTMTTRELFDQASALLRELGGRFPVDGAIGGELEAALNAYDELREQVFATYSGRKLDARPGEVTNPTTNRPAA